MQGLYYLASIIAVGLVMMWLMLNDKLKPGEPTTGFFRMTEPRPKGADPDSRSLLAKIDMPPRDTAGRP